MTAFNQWFNVEAENVEKYKEYIEMLQNTSLLVDIEDDLLMRKGLPGTQVVYGIPATLNSANYYYFLILDKIIEVTPEKVTDEGFPKGFPKGFQ